MRTSTVDDEVQVYEPHRVGLPKLVPYFSDLLGRREFAAELSRATLRASHSSTFFGRLWLVINPTMLALVYFLLVNILSGGNRGPDFLVHLVAGLFFFYFISGCLTTGAGSVTSGGKLISTLAFPRLLMPLSAVRSAFFRFLPTMIVYVVIFVLAGMQFKPQMLLAVFFLGFGVAFGAGLAAFFATLQVYFRDTASFLPYFVRIWLYLSPVLWYADQARQHYGATGARFAAINPLYTIIGGWSDLIVRGEVPVLSTWIFAAAWAGFALLVGFLYFISREREFAVRL